MTGDEDMAWQGPTADQPQAGVPTSADAAARNGTGDRDIAQRLIEAADQFYSSADEHVTRRLMLSETSIAVHLTDADPLGYSLYLDAEHGQPTVEPEPREDCEIQLYIPTPILLDVYAGKVHLSISIANGDASYRGPVRKFLAVAPCMQRMDFKVWMPLFKDAGTLGET